MPTLKNPPAAFRRPVVNSEAGTRSANVNPAERPPRVNEAELLGRRASARDVVRVGVLGLWAAAFVFVLARYGIPWEREQILAWALGFVVAFSVAIGPNSNRVARAVLEWSVLGALLVAYDYSRGIAHGLGMPIQFEAPIVVDRFLFPGDVPSVELQERLGPFRGQHWWEAAVSLVYTSHFFVPYVTTAIAWLWGRQRWRTWLGQFGGVTALGLLGYVLLPTAPPWLASTVGHLDGVERVALRGWHLLNLDVAGRVIEKGQAVLNPVAAFPSLHAAYPVLVAVFFWPRLRSWRSVVLRVALTAYPLAMGFVLVLSGEHYVVDVLAGWAVVALVVAVARRRRGIRRTRARAREVTRDLLDRKPQPSSERRTAGAATECLL